MSLYNTVSRVLNQSSDLIEYLRFELNFLEQGGYGRSVRTPWRPTSTFQDSPSCLNFGDSTRPHPCNECQLLQFVPPDRRNAGVPCHFIPLNATGETPNSLLGDRPRLEEALSQWLRSTIAALESEQVKRDGRDAQPTKEAGS